MKRSPLDDRELKNLTAIELFYGGNVDQGQRFLEDAWTSKYPINMEVIREFYQRLENSSYFKDLIKQIQPSWNIESMALG